MFKRNELDIALSVGGPLLSVSSPVNSTETCLEGWRKEMCTVLIGDAYWSGRFNIAVDHWEIGF